MLDIRDARSGDEDAIVSLLREFAEFERLTHIFQLTPEIIRRDFIGERRRVQCAVAEVDGAIVGLMTWFPSYRTFAAKPGIFLEDLYIKPEFRRRGIARAMLQHLAQRALKEGSDHIDWSVLDWNRSAVEFYEGLGAQHAPEWQIYGLSADAFAELAKA